MESATVSYVQRQAVTFFSNVLETSIEFRKAFGAEEASSATKVSSFLVWLDEELDRFCERVEKQVRSCLLYRWRHNFFHFNYFAEKKVGVCFWNMCHFRTNLLIVSLDPDVHPVDTVGDDRGVRAVCPAAKREDEGRGQPGRRLPHRLQIPSERWTHGKIRFTSFSRHDTIIIVSL